MTIEDEIRDLEKALETHQKAANLADERVRATQTELGDARERQRVESKNTPGQRIAERLVTAYDDSGGVKRLCFNYSSMGGYLATDSTHRYVCFENRLADVRRCVAKAIDSALAARPTPEEIVKARNGAFDEAAGIFDTGSSWSEHAISQAILARKVSL